MSCAIRCASSTGALPGASSGRQRRHGRKPACSASCGVSKKRQLARLRRLCRTNRAAVDARRRDPDEEHAVEPRIAGGQGLVQPAGRRLSIHPPYGSAARRSSHFRTSTIVRFTCPKMASAATPPILYSTWNRGGGCTRRRSTPPGVMEQTEDPDDTKMLEQQSVMSTRRWLLPSGGSRWSRRTTAWPRSCGRTTDRPRAIERRGRGDRASRAGRGRASARGIFAGRRTRST